jgi:RNA polymerase sigma factor for flagellar operon FliA
MYTATGRNNQTDILLAEHASLVKRMAYQLKAKLPASVEVDDLIQAGMIGLLNASSKYEDNHGAQFTTYISQRIRGAMLDELRSADWVPRSVRKNMRDVETAMKALEQRLGRPPTESEVARKLNLDISAYYEMLNNCSGHQLVYYEDFNEEEGDHFLDRHLMDGNGVNDVMQTLMTSEFRDALIEAIKDLPDREQMLMGLYYEQELNLKEIGAVMNVSESRVCQLHTQAIARLRASLKDS